MRWSGDEDAIQSAGILAILADGAMVRLGKRGRLPADLGCLPAALQFPDGQLLLPDPSGGAISGWGFPLGGGGFRRGCRVPGLLLCLPLFSFQVDSPVYGVGLTAFLATGLVITRLVTKTRAAAELSRMHHERLQRLYEFSQTVLALEPTLKGGAQVLESLCGTFDIKAACLFDALDDEVYVAGEPSDDLEKKTGQAFIHGKDYDDSPRRLAARCMRISGRTIGAIGFEGLEDPDLMAGPLAALVAAHLERTRSSNCQPSHGSGANRVLPVGDSGCAGA